MVYLLLKLKLCKGVLMWLLSQGDKVEVTKPEQFRNEVKEIVNNLYNIYNK